MAFDSVSFQDYQFQSHVIPKYIYNHFPVRESLYDEQAFIIKLANSEYSEYSKVKEDKAIFLVSFNGLDFFDPIQNIERIDDYMKRFSHVKKVYFDFLFSKLYIIREKNANYIYFQEFFIESMYNYREVAYKSFFQCLNQTEFNELVTRYQHYHLYQKLDLIESCMNPVSIQKHDYLWNKNGLQDYFSLNQIILSIWSDFDFDKRKSVYQIKFFLFRIRKENFYNVTGFTVFLWEIANHSRIKTISIKNWKLEDIFYAFSEEWISITCNRFISYLDGIQIPKDFIISSDICDEFLSIMERYRFNYPDNCITENKMIKILTFIKHFVFDAKQCVFGSFLSNICSYVYGSYGYIILIARVQKSDDDPNEIRDSIINNSYQNVEFYLYYCNSEHLEGFKRFVKANYLSEFRYIKIMIVYDLLNAKSFVKTHLNGFNPKNSYIVTESRFLLNFFLYRTTDYPQRRTENQEMIFNEMCKDKRGNPRLEGSYITKNIDSLNFFKEKHNMFSD